MTGLAGSRVRAQLIGITVGVMLVLASQKAMAQSKTVGDVLSFLMTNRSVATGDFVHDEQAAALARDAIEGFLLLDLATLPISASSGGFTYRLNPALGTVERASDSFGPFFTERSLTAGRHQASFGLSVQTAAFDTIDGRKLRDGTLVATASKFRTQAQPFDIETVSLSIRTTTTTFLADYGLADTLDVGVAVPLVSSNLSGQRIDTYRGQAYLQGSGSAKATGPGDIAVRAKYNVLRRGGSGLALGGEVRLPTGDDRNLLGAGKAAARPLVIASYDQGPVGAHMNVGYTVGGLSNEVNYGGAVTVAGTNRLTLVGEVNGRHIAKLGSLGDTTEANPTIPGVDTIRLTSAGQGTDRVVVVGGFKWNLAATWLLSAYVLRPVTTTGLNAPWIPSVTFDYSFGR